MWLQLKSGPEDSGMNLGALVAVAVFVVMVFDVVAVVWLLSLLVVVVVVVVVVVAGVTVVLDPGQLSRPGTAAASQSNTTAGANLIFRLSHSDQEESQEGSGASHSMI